MVVASRQSQGNQTRPNQESNEQPPQIQAHTHTDMDNHACAQVVTSSQACKRTKHDPDTHARTKSPETDTDTNQTQGWRRALPGIRGAVGEAPKGLGRGRAARAEVAEAPSGRGRAQFTLISCHGSQMGVSDNRDRSQHGNGFLFGSLSTPTRRGPPF